MTYVPRRAIFLVALGLSISATGCGDVSDSDGAGGSSGNSGTAGGGGAGGAGCDSDCNVVGVSQCSGAAVQRCQEETDGCLTWADEIVCDSIDADATCEVLGDDAVCDLPCVDSCSTQGSTQCSEATSQTCAVDTDGCLAWSDQTDCSATGDLCDASGGTAICVASCTDTCPADGDTRCDADAVQLCATAANGCLTWSEVSDCANAGNVCDDTSGTPTCACVPTCLTGADCDDSDATTDDVCSAADTCAAACSNPPSGCVSAADCDDGNECTVNTCNESSACEETTACPGGVCDSSLLHCVDEHGYLHPWTSAQLTQQATAADAQTATIELLTGSLFPYLMGIESLDLPNTDMSVLSMTETTRDCPTTQDPPVCIQLWTFVVDISDPAVCTLNGDYLAHFTYSCAPGADCAAFDPSHTTHEIGLTLSSENFCD